MPRWSAMILAGGGGEGLGVLTRRRAVAAVPFGGSYRVIDFALSNCVNSGIVDLAVLTQQSPSGLRRHIGRGRPWDLDRRDGGVRILQPYLHREKGQWYRGTAEALSQNLDYIEDSKAELFLVLCGDAVYKMDYQRMLAFHRAAGAEATLAVKRVPLGEAGRFGIVEIDADGRVVAFEEKPADPKSDLAFMGIYLFSRAGLLESLAQVGQGGKGFDLVADVLPDFVAEGRVLVYRFGGYWEDVGTLAAYYRAHMDLLRPNTTLRLDDPDWPIHTRGPQMPPAHFARGARCRSSLVAEGVIVEGEVVESILYPGARVGRGASVKRSILMPGTRVEDGAVVEDAVLDEKVVVEAGTRVAPGEGEAVSVVGECEVVQG